MKSPISTPKFCQKHMKIHVCKEQDIFKQNESIEKMLNEKVRRLHGIQTEEEILKQSIKSKPKPGTIEYILKNAKEKIKKEKAKLNLEDNNDEIVKVDESDLTTRMETLRLKLLNSNKDESINLNETKFNKKQKGAKQKNIYDIKFEPEIKLINKNDDTLEINLNKLNKKVLKKLNLLDDPNLEDNKTIYTEEQTQDFVRTAIQEALKEAGYIKNKKKKPVDD
ncbi:hypothetical protein SCORR_v1c04780 [Spiroplasma corruscae]|uniref:Uncharacterized protein n=1 Tax=Spiroplasma corruscae TaxID=216934 RepID=A0A222EP39_9MOLU|nr:hypothetical protein [Spiroplasma corruscae]ASP28250.1 hypothetical protein SCORR_v1c04780 [Spiroplasma corruscae]